MVEEGLMWERPLCQGRVLDNEKSEGDPHPA